MKVDIHRNRELTADLDLTKEKEQRISVTVAEYKIKIKKHELYLFGHQTSEGTLSLKIRSRCAPEDRIKTDGRHLLTLECQGKKGPDIEVQINGEQFVMLKVMFRPSVIEDCGNRDISEFKIPYDIECKVTSKSRLPFGHDENEVILKKDETKVHLVNISVEPEMLLEPNSFVYETRCVETMLRISNSSVLAYAPSTAIKITSVKLFDATGITFIPDAVEVLWPQARASERYTPEGTTIYTEGQMQCIANNNHEIENIHPKSGYYIGIPLSIDFTKLSNPQQDQDYYRLNIEYQFWDSKDSRRRNGDTKTIQIIVLKNNQRVELGVNLQEEHYDGYRNMLEIEEDSLFNMPIIVNRRETHKTYRIAVQNTATVIQAEHPNAGIVIKEFKSSALRFRNGVVTKSSANTTIDISSICSVAPCSQNEIVLLSNQGISIKLEFNGNNQIDHFIGNNGTKIFEAEAEVNLSFKYYIDETGDRQPSEPLKSYHGTVVFKFEIEPSREWLGIDFGTSAVVALYGNSFGLDQVRNEPLTYLRDLKRTKELGLRRAYPNENDKKRNVTDEELFINSKIVLGDRFPEGERDVTRFEDYPKGIILFSPGDEFTYTKLLPSLKSMMGHEFVPYRSGGAIEPPLVNDVYEMAYMQLFNLYLRDIPAEKIVMTYPNTFAPEHIANLKKFAAKCLPTLRKNHIITVSESDAVAFHYLMKRHEFVGVAKDTDQHVLIYDMGAGTLDITYVSNILNREGKREIDIKGKFGISMAGNYLDYVLAEIVVEICRNHGFKDPNGDSFESYIDLNSATDVATRSRLKNYVKNQLKPMLANIHEGTMMPKWDGVLESSGSLEDVPLSEVYLDGKFKTFLKDISVGVVEKCDQLFEGGLKQVDAVVFSGRMTSVQTIRSAVITAVKSKAGDNVFEFDIANNKANPNQERKSAVVEGALDYVESFITSNKNVLLPSKPFFARYCIITYEKPDKYGVIDIVDNSMARVRYSQSTNIDLSDVNALYLIQTFAVSKQDIIDDFRGDRNVTTILGSRDTSNLSNKFEVAVKVICNETGNRYDQGVEAVELWIGGNRQKCNPHDNINSPAFRKSAWPIIL